MGYSDAVTRDLNSVSSNEDEGLDLNARDEKGNPAFLRAETEGLNAPADVVDANEEGLPKFQRNPSLAENTPAIVQHTGGGHRISPINAAKTARNKKSLKKDKDVIRTTRSGKK